MSKLHAGPGGPYVANDAVYRADRYYRYAEMTTLLQRWAAEYPTLASLSSIGSTYEGRSIWCMTLTQSATGAAQDKPAHFIDANIHAGELAGSAVALYTIQDVLARYGQDAAITKLLDERTLYIVPRVSADGAELYLTSADRPRSSVRIYPEPNGRRGLLPRDLDGDGWCAQMRVPDPHGPYKVCAEDPRLMVPRGPDEDGGQYYWVLQEGLLEGYDAATDGLLAEINVAQRPWGLDLNRNFPIAWEPEAQTEGAGPYPLSEPETRALGEFLLSHPNISGSQHYHTFAGVILRPSSRRADADFIPADLAAYKAIGKIGADETGYPCISLFHDFTDDPKRLYAGMLIDWAYDHLGLMTYSTELWNLGAVVGLASADQPLGFYFGDTRAAADDVAMLKWVDEHLEGFGYLPWSTFDHPQLGAVELGGWVTKFTFQNPPGPLLEDICKRNAAFTLRAAAAGPRLTIQAAAAVALGDGVYRIEAVVQNAGYLPTSGTELAAKLKVLQPDKAWLEAAPGLTVVTGPREQELGHLPGRVAQYKPLSAFPALGLPTRRKVQWVVQATAGMTVTVTVASQRGGRATVTLEL